MTLFVECGEALMAGASLHPIEVGDGLRWSETLATGGVTTSSAPPTSAAHRAVVFTLTPQANGWVAIGATPDASIATARRRMLNGVPRAFVASEGARVAWLVG